MNINLLNYSDHPILPPQSMITIRDLGTTIFGRKIAKTYNEFYICNLIGDISVLSTVLMGQRPMTMIVKHIEEITEINKTKLDPQSRRKTLNLSKDVEIKFYKLHVFSPNDLDDRAKLVLSYKQKYEEIINNNEQNFQQNLTIAREHYEKSLQVFNTMLQIERAERQDALVSQFRQNLDQEHKLMNSLGTAFSSGDGLMLKEMPSKDQSQQPK